jgi:hypothetical protein
METSVADCHSGDFVSSDSDLVFDPSTHQSGDVSARNHFGSTG